MPYKSIAVIEDAILDALAAALTGPDTAQVKTLKSYGGELEGDDLLALVKLFPAVLVVYGGSRYQEHGSDKMETVRFVLIAADRSWRSEAEARRGLSLNPGTYKLLNDCRSALCGRDFSLDIEPFRLVSESNAYTGEKASIYTQVWETGQSHFYAFEGA